MLIHTESCKQNTKPPKSVIITASNHLVICYILINYLLIRFNCRLPLENLFHQIYGDTSVFVCNQILNDKPKNSSPI